MKMKLKNIIVTLSLLIAPLISSNSALAMKIGLVDGVSQVSVGTSKDAELISPLHNKSFYKLSAMKAYPFKATGNTISIELQNQWFNLNINRLVIKPAEKGFISTKRRWYRGEFIIENRGGNLVVINNLPLEDYLLGVVPSQQEAMPLQTEEKEHPEATILKILQKTKHTVVPLQKQQPLIVQ